ncbi:hypothetical protein GCM10023169_13870 [Georgenia halophila]|uniref:Uncharacterized protein n=1 Tax=Georgenia halophila TaxID=620889 RepID=A0ABP8L2V8_9MICO
MRRGARLPFEHSDPHVDALTIRLQPLHTAIASERTKRQFPQRDNFTPPAHWAPTFTKSAAASSHARDLTFADASDLAVTLLTPAPFPGSDDATWHPEAAAWST